MSETRVLLERFACYDSDILTSSPPKEKRKAKNAGIFLLLLFCLSLASNGYAFFMIFGNLFFSLFIALFCSLFFLNIYRLILASTGSRLLPHLQKKRRPILSYFFKLSYILFFTVVSSKPLEVFIFTKPIETKLAAYEAAQIADFRAQIDNLNGQEIATLTKLVQEYETELTQIESELGQAKDKFSRSYLVSTQEQLIEKISGPKARLTQLTSENARNMAHYKKKISASPHFIQRLKILFSDYPLSWLITLGIFIIFGMPFFYRLGFVLRRKEKATTYERQKAAIEDQIIRSAYQNFKAQYQKALKQQTGQDLSFYEYCEDPPYNTVRRQANHKKVERSYGFKKWLLDENAD